MTDQMAARAMGLVMVVFTLLWTLSAYLTHTAPPLDIVEGLIWGNEWLWGTDKHPPLPAWLIEVFWQIGGIAGVYFLASLALALGLWFVFLLGRRLLGAERAALGAALLLGLIYFLWPVPEFNHNMAQMPLWAAVIFLFHLCLTDQRIHFWLLLGLAAALCVLMKYTSVFLLLCVPVWLLFDFRARRLLLTLGPWASLLIFLIVLSPHLNFLVENDFLPFEYVAERAGEGRSPLRFLLAQLLNHLPMILILAAAGFFGRGAMMLSMRSLSRDDRFLLFFALGPFILFVLILSIFGAGFRSMWGAPFFMLSGLLAVRFLGGRWTLARSRRAIYGAITLGVAAPLCYGVFIGSRDLILTAPKREHWPQKEVSAQVEKHYHQRTDRPLEVIVGRVEIAGLAAMGISGDGSSRPSVLIEGDYETSPWIKEENICKATIVIWKGDQLKEAFQSIIDQCAIIDQYDLTAPHIKLIFPIKGFPNAPPLVLNMVVLAAP